MSVNITYRGSIASATVAKNSVVNKNAPLTNAEIDGNFKSIQDEMNNFTVDADQVQFAPNESVISTNVQAALVEVDGKITNKQDILVSGTNIKTIGGETVLGAGNIDLISIDGTSLIGNSDIKFKSVNGETIIGTGNIVIDAGIQIDDGSTTSTGDTWSAKHINDSIDNMGSSVMAELLGGVGGAYDTLKELADALATSTGMAEALIVSLAGKQDTLVETGTGANFKTIENQSMLGSGNIDLVSIAGQSLIGTGNIEFKTVGNTLITGTGNIVLPTINDSGTGASDIWSADKIGKEIAKKGDVSYTGTGAFTVLRETASEITATDINLSTANVFYRNITATTALTFSGAAPSGKVSTCIVELTNTLTTAPTVTWPTSVKWPGSTAPTLTANSTDIFGFYTRDGGATYRGLVLAKNSK